ncbi:ribosomal protein S5 domain 2-type protein [Dipodascopsis tothii]|uniref:ribosomal protein S5 domain 2-type protein n=1 Tax=Dipodascopsis tothii TaxID=44089 RepID=UPI0034CD37C0
MASLPFMVSAPGKVILFGEHAAVYGKPAIAAAVSMRSYLLMSASADPDALTIQFPDVSFTHTWSLASLPWDKFEAVRAHERVRPGTELHEDLVAALEPALGTVADSFQRVSALTFLYLYLSICRREQTGVVATVRSTLPIGAGLGSSASISVCIASAMCVLTGEVPVPTGEDSPMNYASTEIIDGWAFLGEKCIHGTPSGIDNTVASHGGAVMFQRMGKGNPNVRNTMRSFPPIRLLLVDSRQPRRTAVQVANVATLLEEQPAITEALLQGIHALATEAYRLMQMSAAECGPEWSARVRELVRINHGLLVALGVSHPKLEAIKIACDEHAVGETKLTGAGGGGCAITLLHDDVAADRLDALRARLEGDGFRMYETILGGAGVGCLFPGAGVPAAAFSDEALLALAGRDEVEAAVGVGGVAGWSFW